MQKVVIRAYGHYKPGDLVDVPDGAEVSPLYLADAPSGVAGRAVREAEAAAEAAAAAKSGRDRADAPASQLKPAAAPAAAGTPKAGA